jgi:predicted metalloprotease
MNYSGGDCGKGGSFEDFLGLVKYFVAIEVKHVVVHNFGKHTSVNSKVRLKPYGLFM